MKKKSMLFILIFLTGASGAFAATATAVLKPTSSESTISGQVELEDTDGGLKISLNLDHMPPGRHAFHVHESGFCTNGGNDAGPHYNPNGNPHGNVFKDGVEHVHAGDLGNITIGSSGSGNFETVVPGLTVSGGKYNVAGRAFIVHASEDDFSQPAGNAGSRIACGVIEAH